MNKLFTTILMLMTLGVSSTFAASFVVTTEVDSGPGSIRQAVLDANSNGNPLEVDTITFDPGVKSIHLEVSRPPVENGPLNILESVHIQGPGSGELTLDGHIAWLSGDGVFNAGFPDDPGNIYINASGLVFEVGVLSEDNSGIQFTLSGMTVTRTGGMVESREGADVTILNVVARHNAYDITHPEGLIAHAGNGKLTIEDCMFSGNKTNAFNYIFGSNVYISKTTIATNSSRGEFGIWTTGDSTNIIDSQILDNGIQHRFASSSVYITNSVIRNTHQNFFSLIEVVNAEFHLSNSTIYANST
jgi:hypothetical protein